MECCTTTQDKVKHSAVASYTLKTHIHIGSSNMKNCRIGDTACDTACQCKQGPHNLPWLEAVPAWRSGDGSQKQPEQSPVPVVPAEPMLLPAASLPLLLGAPGQCAGASYLLYENAVVDASAPVPSLPLVLHLSQKWGVK